MLLLSGYDVILFLMPGAVLVRAHLLGCITTTDSADDQCIKRKVGLVGSRL